MCSKSLKKTYLTSWEVLRKVFEAKSWWGAGNSSWPNNTVTNFMICFSKGQFFRLFPSSKPSSPFLTYYSVKFSFDNLWSMTEWHLLWGSTQYMKYCTKHRVIVSVGAVGAIAPNPRILKISYWYIGFSPTDLLVRIIFASKLVLALNLFNS